ncbi:BamA/TamA family outer membrane protein [Jiulongibacter sp. NS-SX5]|uniref:BamA/TamA family outer membrane protein n=1 Tax=Jiulongibacter sp. NS-SX5 TaxID=3463854 RepID=UPI004059CC61
MRAFFLFLLLPVLSFGQKKWSIDSLLNKEFNLLPIPSVVISPEVGVMFGVFVDYYYKTTPDEDTTTRSSLSFIDVQYSTRRQLNTELFMSAYTPYEKYYVFFRAGYFDELERYWGTTTPTLPNEDFLNIHYQRFRVFGRLSRNLGKRRFAGLGYQYNRFFNSSVDEAPFDEIMPTGTNSTIIGGGPVFTIDKRDNQFSPKRGMYLDLYSYSMFDLKANKFAYQLINADFRKYKEVKKHVLAAQLLVQSSVGEVPIMEKFRLGGPKLVRGLFMGHFRDDHLWALQGEYRYELWPLIKVAGFASMGNTSPTFSSLLNQKVIAGYGAGLRLRINKSKQVYAAFDYARTSIGTDGFYMKLGDAF